MVITDDGGLKLKCDKCRAPIVGAATPIVGVHGVVRVFHAGCTASEYQFLVASVARQMTLKVMFNELLTSVGWTSTDLEP